MVGRATSAVKTSGSVMDTRARYVLDSYALLAYLKDEKGAEQVQQLLAEAERRRAQAVISVVNLGEVLYIVERHRGLEEAQRTAGLVEQLPIEVSDVGRAQTFRAAHVKARHSISYADAFAVALAQEVGATVVTGDAEFALVEHLVPVKWIARECIDRRR